MAYQVSCQYAHHDHSESEDLGTMESADVLRRFDAFDWSREVVDAQRLGKSAPTLSVEEPSGGRLIWVSAYGDPSSMMFVSQCRLAKVELDTQDFKQGDARRALELFMRGQDEELEALYR
jgi:hypothetical protein